MTISKRFLSATGAQRNPESLKEKGSDDATGTIEAGRQRRLDCSGGPFFTAVGAAAGVAAVAVPEIRCGLGLDTCPTVRITPATQPVIAQPVASQVNAPFEFTASDAVITSFSKLFKDEENFNIEFKLRTTVPTCVLDIDGPDASKVFITGHHGGHQMDLCTPGGTASCDNNLGSHGKLELRPSSLKYSYLWEAIERRSNVCKFRITKIS